MFKVFFEHPKSVVDPRPVKEFSIEHSECLGPKGIVLAPSSGNTPIYVVVADSAELEGQSKSSFDVPVKTGDT